MAEPASLFDMPPDQTAEVHADAVARAEIQAGKGVPHLRVREWLRRLVKGENVPPPSG